MERANDTASGTTAWPQLKEAVWAGRMADAAEAAREEWFDLVAWPPPGSDPVLKQAADEVAGEPVLDALFGRIGLDEPSGIRRAHGRLRTASDAVEDPSSAAAPIDRALVRAAQVELHRRQGRAELARSTARAGIAELDALPAEDPRHADTISGLYALFGACLLEAESAEEAREAFGRGVASALDLDLPSASANLAMLAFTEAREGDTRRAWEHLVASAATTSRARPDDVAMLSIAQAVMALDRLDTATAAQLLARTATGSGGHWVPQLLATATSELLDGHPGRALAVIDQGVRERGAEGRTGTTRGALAPLRAVLQLALGHPDTAAAVLSAGHVGEVARRIGTARVELVLGRHGAALQQLRPLSAMALSVRESAEASALEAAALLRFSTHQRTAPVLDHLGALLANSGELLLPLALLPPHDLTRVSGALGSLGYQPAHAGAPLRSVLLPDAGPDVVLTRRETVVLGSLLLHRSHTAIAAHLNVSVNTVKSQLRSVYRKLDVSTRDEAIAVALERHLLVEKE